MEKVLKYLFCTLIVVILVSAFVKCPQVVNTVEQKIVEMPVSNATYRSISMSIPAVDEEGNGVVTKLIVQAGHGSGRVLVDVNQLLFWVDTQNSIRTAQRVAQNVTKLDLSTVDLTYGIETNASLIGGPSAGVALTVATIAVLENKTLNPEVMITGTINHDGSIGPVGEILAKAKAAKDIGAKLFLVPPDQSVQIYYIPEQHCEQFGLISYCTTEYVTEKIDITKDAGIETKEVANVEEALKYFLK